MTKVSDMSRPKLPANRKTPMFTANVAATKAHHCGNDGKSKKGTVSEVTGKR